LVLQPFAFFEIRTALYTE